MAPDSPDTVLLDEHPVPRPSPPPALAEPPPPDPPHDALPERAWFERPPFWVAAVVLMLLSIPMLVECSGPGSGKKAAASPPMPPKPAPSTAAEVSPAPAPAGAEGGRAEGAPPRATPPSVTPVRPSAEPGKQMVTKCVENGRVIYTQTGACTGSMVPVPIDTEKNLVDSPAPQLRPPSVPSR